MSQSKAIVHFPLLTMNAESMPAFGGELKSFDFKMFARCDRDWARETFFASTQPAAWMVTIDNTKLTEQGKSEILAKAMLVYNALLVATAGPYLDPRLSATYFLHDKGVARLLGPLERTYLLNGSRGPDITKSELTAIATLTDKWARGGLRFDDAVFGPLRAVAAHNASRPNSSAGVMPITVALEGYLLPCRTKGIAAAMTRQAQQLCSARNSQHISAIVRAAYKWRSDVIHGRVHELNYDLNVALVAELRDLCVAIVEAAAERLLANVRSGNDIADLKRVLSQ